jgi:hypothetical protein
VCRDAQQRYRLFPRISLSNKQIGLQVEVRRLKLNVSGCHKIRTYNKVTIRVQPYVGLYEVYSEISRRINSGSSVVIMQFTNFVAPPDLPNIKEDAYTIKIILPCALYVKLCLLFWGININ